MHSIELSLHRPFSRIASTSAWIGYALEGTVKVDAMAHNINAFTPTEASRAGTILDKSPTGGNSPAALARFEFEPGKSNDGTKILMVEWEEDDATRRSPGEWRVSWQGKSTVLPADERTNDHTRRVYFLLPPGTTIPPSITLSHTAAPTLPDPSQSLHPLSMQINPLPAIFPPSLGATARTAGKKGVLHTIWAKKRLQVLHKEIETESKANVESIGLDMALQEKDWIEENFGIAAKSMAISIPSLETPMPGPPISPVTPRSPGGGRLSEKLKGLRLGTSDQELKTSNDGSTHDREAHPLSPETQDVAVSSFATFHQSSGNANSTNRPARTAAQIPPSYIRAQQQDLGGLSMDSIATKKSQAPDGWKSLSRDGGIQEQDYRRPHVGSKERKKSQDSEDELFAKALSPRSPDIPRSPFSLSTEDTLPFGKKGDK